MEEPSKEQIKDLHKRVNEVIPKQNRKEWHEQIKKIDSQEKFNEIKSSLDEMTKQTEKENEHEESSNEGDLAKLLERDKEAQEYMSMCILSGSIKGPEDLDEFAIKQWLADFAKWKAAGKPKASMPKIEKGSVDIPIAIYLLKDKGDNKMYIKCTNEKCIGIEETPIYEKDINPTTGKEIDSNRVLRTIKKYTKKWSEKEAEKVVHDVKTLNGPEAVPQFYFWVNGAKRSANPEDILDFDGTYEKLRTGKYSR